MKLAYMSPWMHHSGGTVCEPVDLPVNKRHFDMVYSHIKYSDKPFMGSVTAPERAEDSVKMAQITFGEDFVDQNCVMIQLINANSPLVFDATMLGALKVYAKHNQACIVSPFILAGAMSPVTVAGTLSQVLAEALAGCALTQLIRPGAPVVFGAFVSSISMQSGAPTSAARKAPCFSRGSKTRPQAQTSPVPFRVARSPHPRAPGCAICAGIRADHSGHLAIRCEFLPSRSRLAGRRIVLFLRKVRHGCRPARHDACTCQGHRNL